MEERTDGILGFFGHLWSLAAAKHSQGAYNSVCLGVLLTLPLVALVTALLVCCHCCCCRGGGGGSPTARSEKQKQQKKKKKGAASEDLWISMKTGPMAPDAVALTVV